MEATTTEEFWESLPEEPTICIGQSKNKVRIIKLFQDVFSPKEGLLKPMKGEPMKIHVRENAEPFALTSARQIPFALRDQVREEILIMLSRGIIKRIGDETSEWGHPLVR